MRTLITGLGLVAALALGGCGFTPLYADQGLVSGLTKIETIAPEGRTGALLRESLDDQLARDGAAAALFRLEIDLKETRTARGRRPDGVASRFEYVGTAAWKLVSKADGKVLTAGVTTAEVTIDRADQPYAAIAGQQDAEQKMADELARKIRLEISIWMAQQREG